MNITVIRNNTPTHSGTYIFVGRYSLLPQLVTVYSHTDTYWKESYLAAGQNASNIACWEGYWSEPVRFVLP